MLIMEADQIKEIISKANAAAKEKNWKKSLEILAPFCEGAQVIPREAYPLLIRSLGKQGSFQQGEKLVTSAPTSLRRKLSFLKAAAELYYESGQHIKSLPFLETIHRNFDGRVGVDASKMYAMVLKGLNQSEVQKSKRRSVGRVSENAGNAYKALQVGDYDRAISCFSDSVFELHGDAVVRNNWLDAFRLTCGLGPISCDAVNTESSTAPLKAFSVAGTGWSGSGAIFDYFSEFATVKKIGGEFPFIQAKSGISGLHNRLHKEDSRIALIDFFKFDVFGFCGAEGLVKQKSARNAKSLVIGKGFEEYSSLARTMMQMLVNSDMKSPASVLPVLRNITDSYLRFRSDIPPEQNSVVPMFDNIIHAYNLDALRFAVNMDLFCSVRDPRSNYVAVKRENRAFDSTVESYVKSYQRKRKKIESKYKTFVSEKENDDALLSQVHFVQFENFVMDRNYRQKLAKMAGLDLAQQDEYSRFKPLVSEKNVFLFEDYENQDEIRYIEEKLPEYCVDLDPFQAMRARP